MIERQTVICGSFQKHLAASFQLRDFLENRGVRVLSPIGGSAVTPDDEFVRLDADPLSDERTIQDAVFAKIRQSTFIVVANIGGYLGTATTMEIGYAVACGIRVFTVEEASDPNVSCYTRTFAEIFPDHRQPEGTVAS